MTRMLFGRARGHWPAQLRFGAPTQGSESHRIGVKPSGVGRVPAGAVKYRQAGTAVRLADLTPVIKERQAAGKTSLRAIAAGPIELGIPTALGGEWSSVQAMRILERIDPFREEEAAAA
jgi:hypothetical protein